MNFKNLLFILVLACALVSCDSFNVVENVNAPEHKKQLVINALLFPEEPISIEVSHTLGVLTYEIDFNRVENLTLKLYENDVLVADTFELTNEYTYSTNIYPKGGNRYRIVAEAPGYEQAAIGEFVMPVPPIIKSVEVREKKDFEDNTQYEISMTISDVNTSETDYYGVVVYRAGLNNPDESFGSGVSLYSSDPAFEIIAQDEFFDDDPNTEKYIGNIGTFTELSMGDKNRAVRFSVQLGSYPFGGDKDVFALALFHFSDGQYKYAQTVDIQNYVGDNPFGTPVQVFNNIQGGLGIVGGANYTATLLEF